VSGDTDERAASKPQTTLEKDRTMDMEHDTLHLTEDDLILHYYGEMSGPEEARASAHLGGCAACQGAYRSLQQVMTAVDQVGVSAFEPSDGFERTAWARLEPELRPGPSGWLSWLVCSPARLAWLGLIVVLVTGAYVAGRLTPATGVAPARSTMSQVRERILLIDLSAHFDRSQLVLVELVSAEGSGDRVDISAERDRARELVAAGRLYRQTAAGTGDARLVEVLDELERVLVDVAASPSEMAREDLESVQQRIDAAGLLFKVRVVSSDLRDRQHTARTPGPASL
jgi:hypothetical protein